MYGIGKQHRGCAIKGRGHCGACYNPFTGCSYRPCACHPERLAPIDDRAELDAYLVPSDAVWAAVEGEQSDLSPIELQQAVRILYDRGETDVDAALILGYSRQAIAKMRKRFGFTYPVEPDWDKIRRAADGEPMRLTRQETIEAIRLLHHRELVDREIAEVMGMNHSTVRKLVQQHVVQGLRNQRRVAEPLDSVA